MKILMATMKMDIGGAETQILEAARELVKRGMDVTVASAGGVFVPELEAAGVHHVTVPLHTKRPMSVLRSYKALDRLLREGGFDVVHSHARIPSVLCGRLCKKHRVRFVTTAHLNFKVNALWRRLTDWGERRLAVSDDIKAYLIREYGCCADNISVTINGINENTYSPDTDWSAQAKEFDLSLGKRRIVHVSRMDRDRSEAGIRLATIAPRLLAACPDVEVLIVGGGDDMERLQAAAEASNRQAGFSLVKLTGARVDISGMIASGEIFVGVSRAAFEAMAMAKPVILAGNQGYHGIFRKEDFARAYDSNFCCRDCPAITDDALTEDLCALLSMSGEDRAALGGDNREIILREYSVGRMTDDYVSLYESVRPYHRKKWGDVLICGYYGFRNMGDDSLLRAILANLREEDPDVAVTVMSGNPTETRRLYGVPAIGRFDPIAVSRAMKHAKVLIFGGGNLLQDGSSYRSLLYYTWVLRMAAHYGLPAMVYANGIGPLTGEKARRVTAKALSTASLITLREFDSVALCEALLSMPEAGGRRPPIRLTADPAFSLAEADGKWIEKRCGAIGMESGKRYFAVALREPKENREETLRAVAHLCDLTYEAYGMVPLFIPMHDPLDHKVNRDVADLCTAPCLFASGMTGSELLGILRRMEFTVAMRLHTLIYASAVGTPSIGLAYDGKLGSFMEYMELPYMLSEPCEEEYLSHVEAILSDRTEISQRLSARKEALCEMAKADAKEAMRFLG